MGEYFKLYNARTNTSLHPHRCSNGLKLGEWLYPGSSVLQCAQALIEEGTWRRDDPLFAVSDYGSRFPLNCEERVFPEDPYDSKEIMPKFFETVGDGWARDIRWTGDGPAPVFDKSMLPKARMVVTDYYGRGDEAAAEWGADS